MPLEVEESKIGPWNEANLLKRTSFLFNNAFFSDVTFLFGGELPMQVPAHKFVLAIGSEVFYSMFYGELKEKDVVEVPDVDPEAFLALLRYIYTDEIRLTAEIVMPALYASKKYMVSNFTDACGTFLASTLEPENAILLFWHSRRFGVEDLQSKCLEMIDSHGELALTSEDFAELDHEAVKLIVQRDTLQCNELTVVKAVEKWATAECVRNGVSTTAEEKRKVLGDILYHLRMMDLDDFVQGIQSNELFTDSERYNLLCYIVSPSKPSMLFPAKPRALQSECTKKALIPTGKTIRVERYFKFYSKAYKSSQQSIELTETKSVFIQGMALWSNSGDLWSTAHLEQKCDDIKFTLLATVAQTDSIELNFIIPVRLDPGEIYILTVTRNYDPAKMYRSLIEGRSEITIPGSDVMVLFAETGQGDTGIHSGEIVALNFQLVAE